VESRRTRRETEKKTGLSYIQQNVGEKKYSLQVTKRAPLVGVNVTVMGTAGYRGEY
jgi:hypothetical protein